MPFGEGRLRLLDARFPRFDDNYEDLLLTNVFVMGGLTNWARSVFPVVPTGPEDANKRHKYGFRYTIKKSSLEKILHAGGVMASGLLDAEDDVGRSILTTERNFEIVNKDRGSLTSACGNISETILKYQKIVEGISGVTPTLLVMSEQVRKELFSHHPVANLQELEDLCGLDSIVCLSSKNSTRTQDKAAVLIPNPKDAEENNAFWTISTRAISRTIQNTDFHDSAFSRLFRPDVCNFIIRRFYSTHTGFDYLECEMHSGFSKSKRAVGVLFTSA